MYKTDYKVHNKIQPSALCDVSLCGGIGEKFDKVIFERLSGEYAREEIFGEAESAFDACADDENAPIGIWQGEFWGKQMISACRAYKYNGDKKLLEFIKESCYRIMSHCREDGYLGTYRNEKQIFRVSRHIGQKIMGWPCEWTWNIWCRKYTLWGMLEAYEVTCDEKLLECAAKSTDQLISMLNEMGARICETGMFYGQPSGSILKPILVLYRMTGEKKYLDFALDIAGQWEDEDTCCTKLITSALNMVPIHEWGYTAVKIQPKSKYNPCVGKGKPVFDISATSPEISGKVYEMLSCFDGILELYRITGIEKYLSAAKNFFELLIRDEYNTLCSVGFNDIFINSGKYQNSISELCDVIHFIRFATELHRLTGEARYIDYAELGFINCFLAGVTRDGKWGARGVRAADTHLFVHLQAGFTKNHCCVNNMPRGFANIAETAVMTSEDSVYVNLYTESENTVHLDGNNSVSVSVSDGYIKKCEVTLGINANFADDKARVIKLRIPEWSKYTVIKSGNQTLALNESGMYYSLPLCDGSSEINIHFDNTPRLIENNYNVDFYPISPYMLQRYISGAVVNTDTMINKNHAVLYVGPVLLARTSELGASKEDICGKRTVVGGNYTVKAVPRDIEGTACAYEVSFCSDKDGYENFTAIMCDFASASDTEEYKEFRYSIFI